MSSEKSPEVIGCTASIMKNVWEIRMREYRQKMQLEQERIEKSALPSINQDWANRLAGKLGNYKKVERKTKPAEPQTESNIWKSKHTQVPPTLPHFAGSGQLSRPGTLSRGLSTQAPNNKDKKVQEKNRLQLLIFITQNQPSTMVWGKSWKYNKSLPIAEGTTTKSDWGQCWMFATQQPYSEEGKPWPNGPNMTDPHSLHLCTKPDFRVLESQEVDLSLPAEEWQMSWRKYDKNNKKEDTSSVNGENVPKLGFFTLMVETQCHNEALCSSEWNESWQCTKLEMEQEHLTIPNDGFESVANMQEKDRDVSSRWEECWRLVNHYGCNKSKLPQVQKSHSPEWDSSWRAAMVAFNNHKDTAPYLGQDHNDTNDDCWQKNESRLHKLMLVCHEQKYRDLHLQLCNEFKALSEWSKSWQVTKNNSKPSEEIEKVLNALPPRTETALEPQKLEKTPNGHYVTLEKADPYYEQVKQNVIYQSKREFTQSKLLLLKYMENVLSSSEWRDSWKTLKHRMRLERRSMRSDPLRLFRESEKGQDIKSTTSEWKDSWKFTCQLLHQEPELWQQGWSTTPQIRLDRASPTNAPAVEKSWGESWMFTRHQHRLEPGQDTAQTSQGGSSMASHHPCNSQAQRKYIRSISDWQAAWMVSETQFHHDKPSLTQWRKAWKRSIFDTKHWTEQASREKWVNEFMEVQPLKWKFSLQRAKAKMSRSFDSQVFRERHPEKEWSAVWRAGSLLNHQPSHYGSSGIPGKSISSTNQQQQAIASEHGSKWGRSFRLANPMPQMEQPWVESSPNPCHYAGIWSVRKNIQNIININFSNNPANLRLWANSHQFLLEANAQINDKNKSKEPTDPRVIVTKKTKTRKHLCSNIEKEKQSERKWAGCHLLGKTQPRPKKDSQKLKMEDETQDKFFEEWAESWRFLVRPDSLKKQMPIKLLLGWNGSWKFLLQQYQPVNGLKAK